MDNLKALYVSRARTARAKRAEEDKQIADERYAKRVAVTQTLIDGYKSQFTKAADNGATSQTICIVEYIGEDDPVYKALVNLCRENELELTAHAPEDGKFHCTISWGS